MLNFINNNLRCDFCRDGILYYEPAETTKAYFVPETFVLSEISEIIDKAINEYLVFKCPLCKNIVKYTLRDIENKIRNTMYQAVISMISIKELRKSNLNVVKKVFIYCGKCHGFDGKGSCPVKMYDECKLKRLPSEL
jgi:hypothetical protein